VKITHVVDARFPLAGYGGTERVATWTMKAQAEAGHDVRVVCRPGSRLPFARCIARDAGGTPVARLVPPDTEITHFWSTVPEDWPDELALLCGIHGNGRPGEAFHANTVFVSEDHARRHGWTEYVYNGLDLDEYPLASGAREDRLVFLAKASWWVKNLRGARRVARAAGLPIDVCGGNAPFPNLDRNARYRGTVDGAEKLRFISNARALLFPVVWNEPFGLAVIEALACGTPVVATPRGALPEIVTDDCGVLADSFGGLVDGVERAQSIPAEACRSRVQSRFTHRHMAEKYLGYYRRILSNGSLRPGAPRRPADVPAQEFLPYRGYSWNLPDVSRFLKSRRSSKGS
jgi:hypothetical protein